MWVVLIFVFWTFSPKVRVMLKIGWCLKSGEYGNHNLCWSDVCWIKDNTELQLQEPILKNYTQIEIKNFQSIITTIFHVPFG